MYVTVSEDHRGLSRSSNYYFIIEENKLMHISRYAISQRRNYDYIEYYVDLSKLRDKRVVEILSSNTRILCKAYAYPAEDLSLRFDQRRREDLPLSYLNGFELAYLELDERRFLQTDWRRYYMPMIEKLYELSEKLRSSGEYLHLPELVACQIKSRANYPLSFLIPYSRSARRKSLEVLTRQIHQLWITARIITELARLGLLERARLDFRQSSPHAIALFRCGGDTCSLWYEFDMNPYTMCGGRLWYTNPPDVLREFYGHVDEVMRKRGLGRTPLRPDVVILHRGANCDELAEGFRVRAIIECKNWEYEYWARDVDNQLIPYREIFRPDTMVLASMKKVPDAVKTSLRRQGIVVIDEVYPGGDGEEELLKFVKSL